MKAAITPATLLNLSTIYKPLGLSDSKGQKMSIWQDFFIKTSYIMKLYLNNF